MKEEKETITIGWFPSGNMYNVKTRRMVFVDDLIKHIQAGGRVVNSETDKDMTIEELQSLY